jgi:serine/threonine protein phosphatase 1
MTFVIGDIHGEITKLKALINNIFYLDKNPHLIFIGDYINKGENSKEVLEYLLEIKINMPQTIFLIGNHEYYYLQYIKNGTFKDEIIKYGLETTFKDFQIDFSSIKEKLYLPYKAIFDFLKPFVETDKYFISHAGVDLNNKDKNFDTLSEDKFFIFKRYDFLSFYNKIHNKIAIFGHTGFNYPYYDGYKIGIDTAASYSKNNRLTAYCLDKEFFINNLNELLDLKDMKLDRTPWINKTIPYRMDNK